jgi:hypothetical protein
VIDFGSFGCWATLTRRWLEAKMITFVSEEAPATGRLSRLAKTA